MPLEDALHIFHLSVPKHGWIELTFGAPPHAFTLIASDVPNDCLCDLAAATARLLRHATLETVEFSMEPGFARCELRRESESVHIFVMHPEHDEPAYDARCPLDAFALRVRSELLRLQPHFSSDEGWPHPFPEQEIARLA